MTYETEYYYALQYEQTSGCFQTARYKKICSRKIIVAKLSCDCNNAKDLKELVLLSDRLQVPVCYDFEEQIAYIKLISADTMKGDK